MVPASVPIRFAGETDTETLAEAQDRAAQREEMAGIVNESAKSEIPASPLPPPSPSTHTHTPTHPHTLPSAARAVEFESTGGGKKLGGKKLVKKTKEHLEAEKNLRGKRRTEDAQKRVDQAKKKAQSQKNHAGDAEGEEQTSWLSSTFF